MQKIEIQTLINKGNKQVWEAYTMPEHIVHWNFATSEWHCPKAQNDLRVGGEYFARMEAKDGSFGFDFKAIYTEITPEKSFTYRLEDNREVSVAFLKEGENTKIIIVFDAETVNPIEMQRAGWQAILNHFKLYTESI